MQQQMKSLHLITLNYKPPPSSSLPSLLLLHRQWPPPTYAATSLPRNPNLSSTTVLRQVCVHCRRRWDSNAETFRSRNFNSNPEKDEDDYENYQRWSEAAQQLIDDIWILKVFKSYGWMLPGIILSFLLATGPKAFLMALALPLGQSAISLALENIWGRKQKTPKHKAKARRKPQRARTRTSRKFESEEEENEENQAGKKGKIDYESWIAGNNGPVNSISEDGPTFGGWDELDRRAKFDTGPTRKSVDGAPRTKSKMSRRERKSDMPLLLRLMIAIFPFLGSWIKML